MSTAPSHPRASSTPVTTTVPRTVWPRWVGRIIAVDAAGSAAIGVALLVAPGWLATGLGLGAGTVRVLGLVLVVNGLVNARAVRRPSRATITPPIVIDTTFAVAVLALAALDPFGATAWGRWLLVGTGLFSVDVAVVKAIGWRSTGRPRGRTAGVEPWTDRG
jgi:hypothetical protein